MVLFLSSSVLRGVVRCGAAGVAPTRVEVDHGASCREGRWAVRLPRLQVRRRRRVRQFRLAPTARALPHRIRLM